MQQGSVFFGRDRNCYPWKIPLGVLEKGCLKPLIVFLGIKMWLSLGLLLPHSWSEKRLKQVLMEMPGSHLVFFLIISVLKRMEPFQAEVQGIKVLQKAWHS